MQLAVKGFSPVASHLACVFLGMALTNSTNYSPKHKQTYSNQVILPLSPSYLSVYYKKHIKKGDSLLIAKIKKNMKKPYCKTMLGHAKALQINKKIILEINKRHARNFLKFLSSEFKQSYTLIPVSQSSSYKPCQNKPVVTYYGK